MKILSKYKDYYDYLSGIYGIDPKIVLDRREYINFIPSSPQLFTLYICGWRINGFYEDGKFFYGEKLKEKSYFKNKKKPKYRFFYRDDRKVVTIKIKEKLIPVSYSINKDTKKLNIKHNCPILIDNYSEVYKYPILSNLEISQIYSPEEIYKMVTQWLSDRITEKELTSDNIPNKEKIINKGFDVKRSFRPKMK